MTFRFQYEQSKGRSGYSSAVVISATWEAEVGGTQVQGQHELFTKILSQNKMQKELGR